MYFYDIEMLYKAGNTSESLLNDINQIVYSLYRAKKILKKVYNNQLNQCNYKWILYL